MPRTHTQPAGATNAPDAVIDIDTGPLKLKPVRDSLSELRGLCQMAIDAAERYTDACKAVAEKAGLEPSVLKGYVTAAVRDKLADHAKRAGQMSLLLEELD